MTDEEIRALLNAPEKDARLANLKSLLASETEKPEIRSDLSNNHIHTTYSFSPYSPTAAVYYARKSGLPVAGIMDHDSMGGAKEFREAAKIADVGATCGFEARISYLGTGFDHVRLNNPDQDGVGYMTFHSVKSRYFDEVQEFLQPLREKRNVRNRRMVENITRVTGIPLDFEKDVLPLSMFHDGGSVTERHLLFALAGKMLPNGTELERFKLLGKLKSDLVPEIFVPATDELMDLDTAVDFAKQIDAILCYAYLGDVTASPTGDKKAAKYEDSFLEELVALLKKRGVNAITFMPSRNTEAQLRRIMALCSDNGFRQISGEDVNALGQSFICEKLTQQGYQHLVQAAWDLVKREED